MSAVLAKAVGVTAAQILLLVGVPAWAMARLQWRTQAEWVFASLVAGVASGALLGRVLNGSVVAVPVALVIWLVVWFVAGVVVRRKKMEIAPPRLDRSLLVILLLAWIVRMIHPLQTWALGQSDAYSHLGFVIDVLERGRLGNGDYPPAYAWVMAFSAWTTHLHPYWTMRFGGAFFGLGLVLGVYMLMSQLRSRAAGLAAAALVAGCPVFWLLQKTGVGSFANQLGLLLLVTGLWAYTSGRRGWLTLALTALAVAVPMMLLHSALLLGVLLVLARGGERERHVGLAIPVAALVLVLAIAIHLSPERGMVVASMLTGQYALAEQTGVGWGDVVRLLASDFSSVKRIGYSSWILNGLALGLTVVFMAAVAHGWRRRVAAWLLVGAWGLLTSLNVHLGLFQFTNYQREGWSLLIAVACSGGLIFDALWLWRKDQRWRGLLISILSLVSAAGLVFPPAHRIAAGPSESEVVRFLLTLDSTVTVLARNISGFPSGQGDVVRTLHPRVISDASGISSAQGLVYFLRDYPEFGREASAVMRILQPALTAESEMTNNGAEAENSRMDIMMKGYHLQSVYHSSWLDVWKVETRDRE